MKKIKILTLSDMPLATSGVGTQTRYIIEGLLKTGKFSVVSLGGAMKHKDYTPIRFEEYGEDWTIIPVNGFGDHNIIRSVLRAEKPDILWFMTDPRYFEWLWEIEDEIRPLCPMVYYHVWDNFPAPDFNRKHYDSTDVIVAISKLTHDVVREVSPNVTCIYHPHAVNGDVFFPQSEHKISNIRKGNFGEDSERFLFFWNNRNARRKMSSSLIWWYKTFLDRVGHDKALLLMHTNPKDVNGPDLEAVVKKLGLTEHQIRFSATSVSPENLAAMYNMADCTINIADAEGFGLATLESLACATPIIATLTGGLQEQVKKGGELYGIGIEPASKAVVGSQNVPYIYEDRVSEESVVSAMEEVFNLSEEDRKALGRKGREHVVKNYNFNKFITGWEEILTNVYNEYGSWGTRKNYNPWAFKEIK